MLRARARYKARMCTLQLGLVPVTQREAGGYIASCDCASCRGNTVVRTLDKVYDERPLHHGKLKGIR